MHKERSHSKLHLHEPDYLPPWIQTPNNIAKDVTF